MALWQSGLPLTRVRGKDRFKRRFYLPAPRVPALLQTVRVAASNPRTSGPLLLIVGAKFGEYLVAVCNPPGQPGSGYRPGDSQPDIVEMRLWHTAPTVVGPAPAMTVRRCEHDHRWDRSAEISRLPNRGAFYRSGSWGSNKRFLPNSWQPSSERPGESQLQTSKVGKVVLKDIRAYGPVRAL